MSMDSAATSQAVQMSNKQSFQLKGSLFTLSVLQLHSQDLAQLEADLAAKVSLAPKFFSHAPIAIDTAHLGENLDGNFFLAIKALLEKYGLVPVGIRNVPPALQPAVKAAGLATLTDSSQAGSKTQDKTKARTNQTTEKPIQQEGFRLITTPIRSGQQVYAQGGDLVVVAPVSPGSELLADGNIHVYNKLKGRALAGVNGNERARIFCHELDAELVAIAGHYQVLENISHQYHHKSTQIYYQDGKILIETIS